MTTRVARTDVLLVGSDTISEENLGLRYIASYLASQGIAAGIEPWDPAARERILARIRRGRPRIVGFSLIFQRMLPEFAELIAYLRRNRVKSHFTIGGHFPTIAPGETLRAIPGLDTVVRHEGEITLLELYRAADQPDSWGAIPGLAFRRSGRVRVNRPRPLIANLDTVPFPARRNQVAQHRGFGICSLIASRGCYYDCSFCSVHEFYSGAPGPNRRTRSPSNVAQEMERLFREQGARLFIFKDDDLSTRGTTQVAWIQDFALELKRRRLADRILWRISCRVDEVDAEPLQRLQEVGLTAVYLGIESGTSQGLKTCNKRFALPAVRRALDILDRLGLMFDFGFMLLDPESTVQSVRDNIAFLGEISDGGRACVHFTKMFPYVGTPIAARLRRERRLTGTLASPDYAFRDRRLNLFQMFLSDVSQKRNFDTQGLVNRLSLARFDALVVAKFLSRRFDAGAYERETRARVDDANQSILATMARAVDFIDRRSTAEIARDWGYLDALLEAQLKADAEISRQITHLVTRYGLTVP